MFINKKNGHKGFTIIEILTVLTIGSILMAMGFLLIGNATRSARNSDRTTDINSINRALSNYVASNNGIPPAHLYISNDTKKAKFCRNSPPINSIDECLGNGITINLKMYTTPNVTLQRTGSVGSSLIPVTDVNLIKISFSARCSTGNAVSNESGNNRRSIAIQYAVETGEPTGSPECTNLYDQ